jgi:hypothetical protein
MAAFWFVLFVTGAAFVAYEDRAGGEPTTFRIAHTGGQLGFVDPVGAPLMVDQATRTEFGDGDEAGAL